MKTGVVKSSRLAGVTIVVTRPEPAASITARALAAAGATVMTIPLLEIKALPAAAVVATFEPLLSELVAPTTVIFVSTHAAQCGVPVLKKMRRFYPLIRHVAIGAATAAKLTSLGAAAVYVPAAGEDSESLLADPLFEKIRGQTIVIVKGASDTGGRALLAESLTARGAIIVAMVCYKRCAIRLAPKARAALELAVLQSTHVLAGSVETLDALELNSGDILLSRIPHLLVPHKRIAAVAKARGVKRISVVSLEDNSLVESLANLAG